MTKKYKSIPDDLEFLINNLKENPEIGDIIRNTNGVRKIRMKITDKKQGKSGGARVIYYIVTDENEIWLLQIYDKANENKIPEKEIKIYLKDMMTIQKKLVN